MFTILRKSKKTQAGELITLKLSGMHCTSCAMNIDGALEEIPGIISSTTSYAKSETKVTYDPEKISVNKIKSAIVQAGYDVLEPTIV